MRLAAPNVAMQAVEESGVLHHGWVRWLQLLYESFGWNPKSSVYADLSLRFVSSSTGTFDSDGLTMPSVATGVDAKINVIGRLPNNYREGSDLEPYMEWMPDDGNAGNVVTEFGYATARVGFVGVAETTSSKTTAAPEVAFQPVRVLFDAVSGTLLKKGDEVVVKFKREGVNVADTYGGGIIIVGWGVKIQIEGIGWEQAHP